MSSSQSDAAGTLKKGLGIAGDLFQIGVSRLSSKDGNKARPPSPPAAPPRPAPAPPPRPSRRPWGWMDGRAVRDRVGVRGRAQCRGLPAGQGAPRRPGPPTPGERGNQGSHLRCCGC